MKVYLYCSYKGSPVGFDIGLVDFNSVHEDFFSMKKEVSEPLVKSLFITGGIKQAYGLVSDNKWLILLKDIDEYKNLAIEFDRFDDYESFLWLVQEKTEVIAEKIERLLFIDKSIPDFGYKVDKKEIESLLNPKKISSSNNIIDILYLVCRKDKTQKQIAESLNINFYGLEQKSENPVGSFCRWSYDKKKALIIKEKTKMKRNIKKASILLAAGVLIGIIFESALIHNFPTLFNKQLSEISTENSELKSENLKLQSEITKMEDYNLYKELVEENPAIKKEFDNRKSK